ncbi:hypothetical protein ACWDV4_21165 [Micromonospora sp. NPDC003197]
MLLAQTSALHALYRECFATPPWSEPEDRLTTFPTHLCGQLSHVGAAGILAFDGPSIVGAVYGWAAPAELARTTQFEIAVADAAPPQALPRLIAPSLVVAEVMVTGTHRRRGIAQGLLAAYTKQWPMAWLVTHRDSGAAEFYRRLGWQQEATFESDAKPLLLFTWTAQQK